MMTFSDWLKQAMRAKGINQTQMAEMTDTTTHSMSEYINDKSYPGWYSMNRIVTKMGYRIEIVPEHGQIKKAEEFEVAYQAGFQYGYQTAVKDMAKRMREMRWYGGDKQEKRAAGVPEHYAGRAGDLQQELQRTDSEGRNGGSMGAGEAEG
jgi:transcriptional regulator with XRE-family HTH domain